MYIPEDQNPIGLVVTEILSFRRTEGWTFSKIKLSCIKYAMLIKTLNLISETLHIPERVGLYPILLLWAT